MEGAWPLSEDAPPPAPPASLEERFQLELPALRKYARVLAGRHASDADVDDLVQEAVARAWRSRSTFDATRTLRPWMRATVLRVWIDTRRELARRASLESDTEREAGAPCAAGAALEEREALDRLLASLEPVERDVLLRFHRSGESVREIATVLGMPEGTVKSHLSRGRRKLARREEDRR